MDHSAVHLAKFQQLEFDIGQKNSLRFEFGHNVCDICLYESPYAVSFCRRDTKYSKFEVETPARIGICE